MLTLTEVSNLLITLGSKIRHPRDLTMYYGQNPIYQRSTLEVVHDPDDISIMKDFRENLLYTNKTLPIKDCHTHQFRLPKRNNKGWRYIVSYKPFYLQLLKDIHALLKYKIKLSDFVVGCKEGVSIPEIVKEFSNHMNDSSYIVHADLKNWFPSIKEEAVVKALENIMETKAAKVIANICTYHKRLPQGSPCSPFIANYIIDTTWGPFVDAYLKKYNLYGKVYVDDLIFVAPNLAEASWHLQNIKAIILKYGFICHKCSIMPPGKRQKVLGCIMNKPLAPRAPRELKKKIRAIMHNYKKDEISCLNKWAELNGLPKAENSVEYFRLKFRFKMFIIGNISWIGATEKNKLILLNEFK